MGVIMDPSQGYFCHDSPQQPHDLMGQAESVFQIFLSGLSSCNFVTACFLIKVTKACM
jgi:hypothetical protein